MQTLDTQAKRVISYGSYEAKSLIKKEEDLCKFYETNRSGLFKKLLRKAYEQYKLSIEPIQAI
tara:strand:+ start:197 stop:385 length:189 start_codon:yes stop_codon:yes gene_type:complete